MIALTSHDSQQSRRNSEHSRDSNETAPSPFRFAGDAGLSLRCRRDASASM